MVPNSTRPACHQWITGDVELIDTPLTMTDSRPSIPPKRINRNLTLVAIANVTGRQLVVVKLHSEEGHVGWPPQWWTPKSSIEASGRDAPQYEWC